MANIQRKYGVCNGLNQKYAIMVVETWTIDGSTHTWYVKPGGILDSFLGYECLHFDTVDAGVMEAKRLQAEWDNRPQDDVIDWPDDEDPQTNDLKQENKNLRTEIKQLQEQIEALKDSEQEWIDKAINFRNLAVALGAKPEQLNDEYCVKLVHDHEQVLMENVALKKKFKQVMDILGQSTKGQMP